VLAYRARLDESAEVIVSVAVRLRPVAGGLGTHRPSASCLVVIRYACAGGRLRRHRGALPVDLPPGTALRVAAFQLSGSEAFITLRPAPPPPRGAGNGAAVMDRFTLPLGLQAWGVTALSGAEIALRLICRGREQELVLRGVVYVTLHSPGGAFRLRIPFLRILAAVVPAGLHWRAMGGVTGLHARVEPGGRIAGELVLAVRCEGRPRPAARLQPPFALLHEVTGTIARLAAEPAGPGHSVVRGALELDMYGTDDQGRSRWAGRTLPFSALLAVAGERLEPFARIERIRHNISAVQATLEVGVTALRPETVQLGAAPFRLERILGTAVTTLVLSQPVKEDGERSGKPGTTERRDGFLPVPGPAAGWEEVAVVISAPGVEPLRGASRWSVRAALGGTPAGEAPYPAPLRATTGGTAELAEGQALAVIPALVAANSAGMRLRTTLVRGPALPLAGEPRAGENVKGDLTLPGEISAVTGLRVLDSGEIAALIKAKHALMINGQIAAMAGRPVAATAFPVVHDGQWQLRVVITQAKDGRAER